MCRYEGIQKARSHNLITTSFLYLYVVTCSRNLCSLQVRQKVVSKVETLKCREAEWLRRREIKMSSGRATEKPRGRETEMSSDWVTEWPSGWAAEWSRARVTKRPSDWEVEWPRGCKYRSSSEVHSMLIIEFWLNTSTYLLIISTM